MKPRDPRVPHAAASATPLAACALGVLLLLGLADSPALASSDDRRALLDTYCIACHNERLKTAGLILEAAAVDTADVAGSAEVWEKVLRKVRSGEMPPAGRRRPDAATRAHFTAELIGELDAAAEASPDPGRPAVHRLNRTEYVNAIRDLLDLEIDGRALLPPDDSGYGFDNNADVLTMSPALLDRYIAAATKIGRLAIGDSRITPAVATYRIPRSVRQNERMSEALPFGRRGGIAVRHMFPLDGEYVFRVRLSRNGDYGIGGLDRGRRNRDTAGPPADKDVHGRRYRRVEGADVRQPGADSARSTRFTKTEDLRQHGGRRFRRADAGRGRHPRGGRRVRQVFRCPGSGRARQPRAFARVCRDPGAVQRVGAGRHAQPAANIRLSAGRFRRGAVVRPARFCRSSRGARFAGR